MWLVLGSGLFGGIGIQVMMFIFGSMETWDAIPWLITFGSLAGFGITYRTFLNRLAQRMTPVEQRLGLTEGLKRQAEAMPRWYLVIVVVFAALAVAGSAFWMIAGTSIAKHLLGFVGVAFFTTIMAQARYGLTHRQESPTV